MSDLAGCFSHKSDNWKTPKKIYDFFMKRGFTDCFKYMSEEDEFKKSYRGGAYLLTLHIAKWGRS